MTSAADSDSASISIADEADLGRFATQLAACLPAHAFVALRGDLGAGKTTLVKALAAADGIDPADVVSPTFGLIHLHDAPAATPPAKPKRSFHSAPAVTGGVRRFPHFGQPDQRCLPFGEIVGDGGEQLPLVVAPARHPALGIDGMPRLLAPTDGPTHTGAKILPLLIGQMADHFEN